MFTQAFDRPDMDAALLLLPRTGFVAWDDQRMLRTVDAVRAELEVDGLLLRYRAPDGLEGTEGTFVACTFWLVECLARQARTAQAKVAFAKASAAANDLGLFAEDSTRRPACCWATSPRRSPTSPTSPPPSPSPRVAVEEEAMTRDLLVAQLPLLDKVLRTIAVYLFLVLALRLAGKRELAQLNSFDLVVLLLLSNTVQNAIIGPDNSLLGGLLGAAVLLAANYTTVRLGFQYLALARALEGTPTTLGRTAGCWTTTSAAT